MRLTSGQGFKAAGKEKMSEDRAQHKLCDLHGTVSYLPPVPGVKSWHEHNGSGGDIAMTHSHTHTVYTYIWLVFTAAKQTGFSCPEIYRGSYSQPPFNSTSSSNTSSQGGKNCFVTRMIQCIKKHQVEQQEVKERSTPE